MSGKHLICVVSAGIVLACSAGPGAAALPDSVLVRIAGRRDIVRSFVVRSWGQQHADFPADSITPATVSRFLDILTDEALLTEAAVREAAALSPADSAAAVALKDRLVMAVALDSVLRAAQGQPMAPADSANPEGALGVRARTRTVEGLHPVFVDVGLERLARSFAALPKPSPDSSLAAQLRVLALHPLLSREDSSRVLARSSAGDVSAGDVVTAWMRLSIAVRPRIDTSEQVRDMVANLLFERVLRNTAARGHLDRDARVTAPMNRYAEGLARSGYVEREVVRGIRPDSSAINAYWNAHASEWALPAQARGIRLVLADLEAAVRIGAVLANAAQAESLAARAERGGAQYRFVVSERSDPVLFRRAMTAGENAVVGPVADGGSWWVARIGACTPARARGLSEVREEIAARWTSEEAERRALALAVKLRQSLGVEIAPGAAARLSGEIRDMTRSAAGGGVR